jgi:rhodanese-related sulfurtransferase
MGVGRVRKGCRSGVVALALLVAAMSAAAAERVSPDSIPGSTKVDAEALIQLVTDSTDVKLIDSRIASDRLQGYIEGSVSLPDEKTNCATLAEVAPEQASPVVFYCNGPKCGRSAVAVQVALGCGYKDIYWFRGGFEEWKQKKYPYLRE